MLYSTGKYSILCNGVYIKRILQRSKKGWDKEQEQLAIQVFKGVI